MFATHRSTLGALHLVLGLMNLIAAAIVVMVLGGVITLAGDRIVTEVLGLVMTLVGAILGIAALPALVAGYALLKDVEWSRTAAVVSAFLNLAAVPLGTAISVYTMVVVFHGDEAPRA
jgi:hypothetical protein